MLDNLKLPNETIDKAYDDGFQPTVSEIGKLVGRIPKAINAAFAPLDIWIAKQENSIARTKKLLEQNLENVEPEKIVPPEPYVAIPAIQAISYSMDSEELRKMYANLLSKSIYSETKDFVHPSFVEIIKNLSPTDCYVFEYIMKEREIGCYEMRVGYIGERSYHVIHPYLTAMTFSKYNVISASIDNLLRNKLIDHHDFHYDDDKLYSCIRETFAYKAFEDYFSEHPNNEELRPYKMSIKSTSFGKIFYKVCCLGID